MESSIDELWEYIELNAEGAVQFGEHVVISWSENSILVAPLSVHWDGQQPRAFIDPDLAVGSIVIEEPSARETLRELIEKAQRRRKSSFKKCSTCDMSNPPEHMTESQCHACFETQGGVH